MRIEILMRYQDDPRKCTAAKLLSAGLARRIRRVPPGGRRMVLDPYAELVLAPSDRREAGAVVGIDCSWRLAKDEFAPKAGSQGGGTGRNGARHGHAATRRLPPLLAGNPVNYARVGMLTTAEAIAASLFILGYGKEGSDILDRFGWGHTFFDLNCRLLDEYARMKDRDDAARISSEFGLPFL